MVARKFNGACWTHSLQQVYDLKRGRVIFSGGNTDLGLSDDTWSWDEKTELKLEDHTRERNNCYESSLGAGYGFSIVDLQCGHSTENGVFR